MRSPIWSDGREYRWTSLQLHGTDHILKKICWYLNPHQLTPFLTPPKTPPPPPPPPLMESVTDEEIVFLVERILATMRGHGMNCKLNGGRTGMEQRPPSSMGPPAEWWQCSSTMDMGTLSTLSIPRSVPTLWRPSSSRCPGPSIPGRCSTSLVNDLLKGEESLALD